MSQMNVHLVFRQKHKKILGNFCTFFSLAANCLGNVPQIISPYPHNKHPMLILDAHSERFINGGYAN